MLRGRGHTLTTAVVLAQGDKRRRFSVSTDVFFRSDLEDGEIEAYMDLGEAKNCAGGYMVERRGAWLIERGEGDWNNVIGLPVLHLITELRQMGWRYPKRKGSPLDLRDDSQDRGGSPRMDGDGEPTRRSFDRRTLGAFREEQNQLSVASKIKVGRPETSKRAGNQLPPVRTSASSMPAKRWLMFRNKVLVNGGIC